MILRIIVIFILYSTLVAAQYGDVYVKQWEDDKKSVYTFTLDDGLASQVVYGSAVLEKYGFNGTFFVITDHLNEVLPGSWRYTAWSELKSLSLNNHEIGSHSLNHPDLTQLPLGDTLTAGTASYEIYHSKKAVNLKIPEQLCFSFAYPLSAHNSDVRAVTNNYYGAARGAGETFNGALITPDDFMQIKGVPPIFNFPRETLDDDLPELEEHKTLIESSITNGGWMVSMLHEIVPQSELPSVVNLGLWNPISSEWLDLLSGWLHTKSLTGEVWVTTFGEAVKYIKERDSFFSWVISQSENEIRLGVSDQLDNNLYNYPLTVDIAIPPDWQSVRVLQGTISTVVSSFQTGNDFFIRTKVIPDGGEVILLRQDNIGEFTISGKVIYYSSDAPVENVLVIANGMNSFQSSTITGSEGNFSMDVPVGTYNLTLEKTDQYTGINSTDALYVLRHIAGLNVLDSLQQIAADVDNSSIVDSTDAGMILQRFARIRNEFLIPDWLFYPGNPTVILTNSNIHLEFKAIKAGDINFD